MTIYSWPLAATTPFVPAAGADLATETTQLLVLGAVDGLEALVTSTNTKVDATNAKLDTLHADNLVTQGYIDGVETLVTSTNTKLDTLHSDSVLIQGYVDGIETLVTSTNTKIDTTNSKLDTLHADVDGLEGLVTSSNTKLDTVHTDLVNLLTAQKPEYSRAIAPVVHNFGTSGITASAYTQVILSTGAKVVRWQFSNTSGSHLTMASGAVASEVPFCIIPPGGAVEIDITLASTRISVTSDENVSSGKLSVVGLV